MRPSLTLLGTGGPRPDATRGATSLLIEAGEDAILIDAGRGVVRQLAALGVPLARIDPVLITHHHYDHIGELHDVILSSWLTGRARILRLFGPPETRRIVETLLHQVYDKDIEFRVREAGNGPWQPVEVTDILAGTVCEGRGGASPRRSWTTATGSIFPKLSASAGAVSAIASNAPRA